MKLQLDTIKISLKKVIWQGFTENGRLQILFKNKKASYNRSQCVYLNRSTSSPFLPQSKRWG